MEPLPTVEAVEEDIAVAIDAARGAAEERRRLRRRTKRRDPEREKKLRAHLASLALHGGVLRSHLKRSDYHERPYTPEVRRALKRVLRDCRLQRQKIAKMLPQS